MNVVGIAYLPDGTVGARFSDSVKLMFEDKKEVEAFDARPFHYEKQFEMAPGTYNFRLVFSSAAISSAGLKRLLHRAVGSQCIRPQRSRVKQKRPCGQGYGRGT